MFVLIGALILPVLNGQMTPEGWVRAHNDARKLEQASNMLEMKWDPELAASATEYAQQCQFSRSGEVISWERESQRDPSIGQNIYLDMAAGLTIPDVMDFWLEEKQGYNLDSDTCSVETCLHYTQVVWAKTDRVGCGMGNCDGGQALVVCRYKEAGNQDGEAPFEPGEPCSNCPSGACSPSGFCEPGERVEPPPEKDDESDVTRPAVTGGTGRDADLGHRDVEGLNAGAIAGGPRQDIGTVVVAQGQIQPGMKIPLTQLGLDQAGVLVVTEVEELSNCAYSNWGAWLECSNNCGVGQQMRYRKFSGEEKDVPRCNAISESRACTTYPDCYARARAAYTARLIKQQAEEEQRRKEYEERMKEYKIALAKAQRERLIQQAKNALRREQYRKAFGGRRNPTIQISPNYNSLPRSNVKYRRRPIFAQRQYRPQPQSWGYPAANNYQSTRNNYSHNYRNSPTYYQSNYKTSPTNYQSNYPSTNYWGRNANHVSAPRMGRRYLKKKM